MGTQALFTKCCVAWPILPQPLNTIMANHTEKYKLQRFVMFVLGMQWCGFHALENARTIFTGFLLNALRWLLFPHNLHRMHVFLVAVMIVSLPIFLKKNFFDHGAYIRLIFLHTCSTCPQLPSDISTMLLTKKSQKCEFHENWIK